MIEDKAVKIIKNSVLDQTTFCDIGIKVNDSRIGSNSNIYKFSTIKDSIINNNCIIGDLSKVDNCSLGTFVKIEKYNHLYFDQIGDFSYTGPYTVIMHSEIGKFCSISWGVSIGGAEHDYKKVTTHAFLYNSFFQLNNSTEKTYNRFQFPCIIGSDVWIGANSTILRNVRIEHGAVIAANATVTKDVPPYAIVAGSPAKIIKYRFSEEVIYDLMEINWWDFPLELIRNNFHLFNDQPDPKIIERLKEIKDTIQNGGH